MSASRTARFKFPIVRCRRRVLSWLLESASLILFKSLYREVVVPDAVHDEYEAGRQPTEPQLSDLAWLHRVAVSPHPSIPASVNLGEATTIALALCIHARAVLLDERPGRLIAARLGLPIVGTLGILPRAKEAGLLASVRPTIDTMIAHGIRIGPALRTKTLLDADELD